ncbi:MAG: hypothetical protein U0228_18760 [Myxococcaceae bacterium]
MRVLDSFHSDFTEARASADLADSSRNLREVARLLICQVLCVVPAVVATRFQYTWSLLIFIAPLAATASDLHRRGLLRALARPIGISLLLLVPMGVVLTVALADEFFTYPNASAVLGITFPAIDLTGVDHAFQVPIEELLFYVLGFAALLMLYAWADAVLVPALRPLRAPRPSTSLPEMLTSLAFGIALAGAGWVVQRALIPGATGPGYWTYLMLVPMPVVIALAPVIAPRINWPALALVCLALWGHSVLWEVTLAIPQGWWGYQRDAMLGVHLSAWHGLPIEAVVVWLLTPVATIFSFEALRAQLAPLPRRRTP